MGHDSHREHTHNHHTSRQGDTSDDPECTSIDLDVLIGIYRHNVTTWVDYMIDTDSTTQLTAFTLIDTSMVNPDYTISECTPVRLGSLNQYISQAEQRGRGVIVMQSPTGDTSDVVDWLINN